MKNLPCRRIQVDEIWAFVGKKQRQVTVRDDRSQVGDRWTFVAIDPDTKLIPVHLVGKRNLPTATAFMNDLAGRLTNRVQLSSDALAPKFLGQLLDLVSGDVLVASNVASYSFTRSSA
jgi:hypothetical protein